LACVPLALADAFGEIRFDEGAGPDDPRLVDVRCEGDECEGRDAQGVTYAFLGDDLMIKVVQGNGPSARFLDRFEPSRHSPGDVWAGLCELDASWIELRRESDGDPTYGLYAQP
jgi:hypothetical protein